MAALYGVAVLNWYKPGKPQRDEAYMKWVRKFPCVGCGVQYGIDSAHTGPHGIGQKADDKTVLPMCHRKCHPAYDKDPRGFAEKRGLDIAALVEYFNNTYEICERKRA